MKNPIADALISIFLFIALSFLVGFSMAHFFAENDNLMADPYQVTDDAALQLPPLWQSDPSMRGRIRDLLVCDNRLFVTGQGIGIYSLGGDNIWRPFNAGLGANSDITAMASSRKGLIIGSLGGKIYIPKSGAWRLISTSESQRPVQWIFSNDHRIFYADKTNMGILGENSERRLISLDEFTAGAISFLRMEMTFLTGNGRSSISLWRNPHGSASILLRDMNKSDSSYLFARKPDSYALLRTPVAETGIHLGSAPALPDEMMSHNVRDIIIYPTAEANMPPQILAAIDGFGIVNLSVDASGKTKIITVQQHGLPFEPVTSLAFFNDVVYAGTDGKGVYSKNMQGHRFEPLNSGLMYIPQ